MLVSVVGEVANPFCSVSGAAMLVVSEADVAKGGCAAIWLAICAYEEPL